MTRQTAQNHAQTSNRPAPPNAPSQKPGNKSGGGRGNNPPRPKSDSAPRDIGAYIKNGWWS